MRDLAVSCSAGYLNSTPLLDLNYVEDSAGGADVTVGILPKLDKVTLLQVSSLSYHHTSLTSAIKFDLLTVYVSVQNV